MAAPENGRSRNYYGNDKQPRAYAATGKSWQQRNSEESTFNYAKLSRRPTMNERRILLLHAIANCRDSFTCIFTMVCRICCIASKGPIIPSFSGVSAGDRILLASKYLSRDEKHDDDVISDRHIGR